VTFQFTHPLWLLALLIALPWTIWLTLKSDASMNAWRRWVALGLRTVIVLALVLALAGLQWKKPQEGMNALFALDRSESLSSSLQETARAWVNYIADKKERDDKAGVLVFGSDAAIESSPQSKIDLQKVQAVVGVERTDLSAAIRLATAAFPESGQKRIVLLSDGNENVGDGMSALMAAPGVSVDVVPIGVQRGNDVALRKMSAPTSAKKGQTFDVKIFAQADRAQTAVLRLYRNNAFLGEQQVELSAGKNLFSFPQTLEESGFYSYTAQIEASGDTIPQNNKATAFTSVRGNPRVLIISSSPSQEARLASALQSGDFDVKSVGLDRFPATVVEMQSYDAIFLCNIAAGDLGMDAMRMLESAVRDFGVGLVCVGGDQAYAAGGYRGTPLEAALPLEMELSSKKVLPNGAMAIVCHATEFPNGNAWARDIAFAALDALGPQDEMGIVLWDGREKWLFPLAKVGDKAAMGRAISGMNPGDMVEFGSPMNAAYEALKASKANVKHMVVFSDGDPTPPSDALLDSIIAEKITISTVMIGGHVSPNTMEHMADVGNGHFYDVRSPEQLPQIFIKEASVILKSAISEGPFLPQAQTATEVIRGIAPDEYPTLLGYVCSTPKPRAEVPLVTQKGDPLLAHWQYGLGRSVAFTSDAKSKWAANWLGWPKYKQFWSQIAHWSLRRVESTDFTAEVAVDKGEGRLSVEAIDSQGNYRNFLNLQTLVLSPKGQTTRVHLEQTGPGHYEARFSTREVGAYLMNLMQMEGDQLRGSQALGLSVDHSPEFDDPEPNLNLLRRMAEVSGGKVLNMDTDNPFRHDRIKTFQPRDLWEWLLKLAIILFPLDVGVRRIQLGREEWTKILARLKRWFFFWEPAPKTVKTEESLAALLNRREQVRAGQTAPTPAVDPSLFQPEKTANLAAPLPESASSDENAEPPPQAPPPAPPDSGATTASRLLDAKRRAKKRME
jgi:uncharacterized membrane protein